MVDRRYVVAAMILATTAILCDVRGFAKDGFTSEEAAAAKTKYETALERLEAQYKEQVKRATDEYVAELSAAGKIAFEKGDVDEAARIVTATKGASEGREIEKNAEPANPLVTKLKSENSALRRKLRETSKPRKPKVPKEAARFGGHSYLVLPGTMPKRLAVEACREVGGHLIRIDSPEENMMVLELMAQNRLTRTFIEGSDDIAEGRWLFPDGSAMRYFNWKRKQPSNVGADLNGAENAIGLSQDGGWFDISSDARLGGIVEWDH